MRSSGQITLKGAFEGLNKAKFLTVLMLLLLIEVLLGFQIGSTAPVLVAEVFLAVVISVLVAFNAELGIYLLVATLLVSEEHLTRIGIPLGPGRLNIIDCLVLATLISWFAKGIISKNLELKLTSLNVSILGLMLIAVISAIVGIFSGYDTNTVLRELRPFLYLSLFFVVADSVVSLKKIGRLMTIFFLVGVGAAIADIVNYGLALGEYTSQELLQGEIRIFGTGEDTFFVILLIISIVILAGKYSKKIKSLVGFACIPIFLALLTSIIRSNYVGLVFGLLLLVILLKTMSKIKVLRYLIMVACGLVVLILVMTSFSFGSLFLEPVSSRIGTFLSFSSIPTVKYKLEEGVVALATFSRYPFLGAGIGYVFYFPFRGSYESTRTGFIHNDYLYILSKMGIIGVVVLIFLIVSIFSRGLSALGKVRNSNLKNLLAAIIAGIFAVFVISAAAPRLTFIKTAPIVPIFFGLVESVGQADAEAEEK